MIDQLVGSLLPSNLGNIVGGILGGIGGSSPIGQIAGGIGKAISGIGKAFKKLFGRKKKRRHHQCHPQPQPFSNPCANPNINVNQYNPLQNLAGLPAQLNQVSQQIQNVLSQLTGSIPTQLGQAAAAGAGLTGSIPTQLGNLTGASQASSSGVSMSESSSWGKIDSMMAEAEKLMLSDKKEDQLKGQKMMNQATQMFQAISAMLKAAQDMAQTAIRNIAR